MTSRITIMDFPKKESHDRRRYPRIKSINLLYYNFFDQKEFDKRQGIAKTVDISECGMLIECGYPFPLHSILEISVALGEKLISVKGEVVRAMITEEKTYLLGLELTPLSEADKEEMIKYIKGNL